MANEQMAYNKVIEFSEKEELQFLDFSLTYIGRVDLEKKGSLSFFKRNFQVKVDGVEAQILEVLHGQVPPKPLEFQVGNKEFTLYTFKTPDGLDLLDSKLYIKH